MNKILERLRQMKGKAVDRMAELNDAAKKEARDLTETEKTEYAAKKAEAEGLDIEIKELETMSAPTPPKPNPNPPDPNPPNPPDPEALRKQATELERSRVSTIRERLVAAKLPADVAAKLEKTMVDDGVSIENATGLIFKAMADNDAAQPDTRTGLAVQRGNNEKQVETLAREIANRDGVSMHKATVTVINANPKLYDQYLAAHPEQTGARA